MERLYSAKYRQPGQIFWRKLKNLRGDGIEGQFRYFLTLDDQYICISIHSEVIFSPDRNASILEKMSKEAGLPLQRA